MIYGSICSGIGGCAAAWHPLGWKTAFFSEIDPFPTAVLAHHYPDIPNRGDMNDYRSWPLEKIDLLVGGTPCQSFSVAGLRKGLADPRGNLMLVFLGIADRYRPEWLVWENVPGVLSSAGGRDFGTFLGALSELGYGWAYRILDAQYFGVPQRRRRVFVVGHLGDWRRAAAVLFERESLRGDSPPSRKAGQGVARCLATGTNSQRYDGETENFVAHSLRGEGFDTSEDGTGRGTPLAIVPESQLFPIEREFRKIFRDVRKTLSFNANARPDELKLDEKATLTRSQNAAIVTDMRGNGDGSTVGTLTGDHLNRPTDYTPVICIQERACSTGTSGPGGKGFREDVAYTIEARNKVQSVAWHIQDQNTGKSIKAKPSETACTIGTRDLSRYEGSFNSDVIQTHSTVRRLLPTECEALQGFPRNYTLIPYRGKPACDGPRYKAVGNSWAVPVVRWIGRRIESAK